MPGVLMIEGMAQRSALLLEASLKGKEGREARALKLCNFAGADGRGDGVS